MMPNSLGFCFLCSCTCLLPSGYLWCYLVLLSLTVAFPSCKLLCQYSWEISSLWEKFGHEELWYRVSSGLQTEIRWILSPAVPWFLCPDDSELVLLAPGIWVEVVVLPVLSCISLKELFMFSLKSSIIIMRCDFKSVLLFWCVGVSRARCGGRTGFWWCQVALVSVA